MADEIKTAESVVVVTPEVPKTKEEWNKLATDNPTRWQELTQERMDSIVRESRETRTKLEQAEQERKNLVAELEATRQKIPVAPLAEGQKYGVGRYPQTKEQWNDFFLEDPLSASELHNNYLNETRKNQEEYQTSIRTAAQLVQQEHPDMYVAELGDDGQPKKDDKGKIILKRDGNGNAIPNMTSEKGKLWDSIFNEDPQGWSKLKNAPQLLMAEMERRLRAKGASMIKGQNNEVNDDSSGVAPRGVTPPPASSLKFASAEEKAQAESSVRRGTFKSLEEWVQWRDKPTAGYVEQNSRPIFK